MDATDDNKEAMDLDKDQKEINPMCVSSGDNSMSINSANSILIPPTPSNTLNNAGSSALLLQSVAEALSKESKTSGVKKPAATAHLNSLFQQPLKEEDESRASASQLNEDALPPLKN